MAPSTRLIRRNDHSDAGLVGRHHDGLSPAARSSQLDEAVGTCSDTAARVHPIDDTLTGEPRRGVVGGAIGGSTVTRRLIEILISAGHDDVDARANGVAGERIMTNSGTKFIPTRVKGISCVVVGALRRWSRKVTGGKKIGNVTPRFGRDRGSAAIAASGRAQECWLDL
jgi:hypothetical protein